MPALCISCSMTLVPEDEGLCDSVFAIRGVTKSTGVSEYAETNVTHWSVMLFDAGNEHAWYYASSDGDNDIHCTIRKGRPYRAYAIVNYPQDFSPSLIQGESQLLQYESFLWSNTPDALVMFGSRVFPEAPSGVSPIPVERLCSKVVVDKISVNMEDPVYASRDFTLDAVYLTNVCTYSTLGSDYSMPEADYRFWYNAMGWHGSGTLRTLDLLLGDKGIGIKIGNGFSYDSGHTFYTYPNTVTDDSTEEEWSPRHTRLVIEATLGGKKYYYTITLPAMSRGVSYTISEAIIRKPGSLDPEKNVPGAIDASITITEDPWDSEYHTSEES